MINRLKYTVVVGFLAAIPCQAQPQRFTQALSQLHAQIQEPERSGLQIAEALVADWVDLRALSDRAFGSYVEQSLESYEEVLSENAFDELIEAYEQRLAQTVRDRLVRDMAHHLDKPTLRGLSLRSMQDEGESATVAAVNEEGEHILTLEFSSTADSGRVKRICSMNSLTFRLLGSSAPLSSSIPTKQVPMKPSAQRLSR